MLSFSFNAENLVKAEEIISYYPESRQKSAVMGLLYLAQEQNQGWINNDIILFIADYLQMPKVKVLEVASFYTMFNLNEEVGKYLIQICGTVPCSIKNSNDIVKVCKGKLNIGIGESTEDGLFTLKEVECLGACANAPIAQINNIYYEDLTARSFGNILEKLQNGEIVAGGSATGRKSSEPILPLKDIIDIT